MILVLTCEHGGNTIPREYKKYFKNKTILKTHSGIDLGALDLFTHFKTASYFSHFSETSRLLVELNRSLHHKNLFSEFTKGISKIEKTKIINLHYLPYRNLVENNIRSLIAKGELVLHLSIHTFTPILNGVTRTCDIGLLFDSTKTSEKQFSKKFKNQLLIQDSGLKVRFNYPYLGKADGFTTYLRQQFPTQYLGIEIEVNQKFATKNKMNPELKETIVKAFKNIKLDNNPTR